MSNDNIKRFTIVEILVTYISLGWAFVMIVNNDAFDKSANFSRMEAIVNQEWILGIIALTLALIKITGIIISSYRLRWGGLMLSTIFWILVSATFLLSADGIDLNTGFINYGAVSVMCLWTSKEVLLYERNV